jgi:V8-like Glu-specific endopeptidase
MSAQRRSKKAEQRQKAVEMYIKGGSDGPGQAAEEAAALQSLGGVGGEQEFLEAAVADRGNDTSVSSDDQLDAKEMTQPSGGEMGAEEVESGQEVEVHQESGEETAAEAAPAEERYLLDAWHAEFSDDGQRAMMLAQADADENVLEIVLGTDDRVRVTNVTAFPWRVICSLKIRGRDGSRWIGTGWLIGRRTLITAGHCVYIHNRGGWASSIEVIPGRNAAERPFGSCRATSFRSVLGWTQKRLRTHDYAAIILPEDCPYGDKLGFFGLANLSDAALNQLTVNLSGYPGDKPPGTQWFHSRQLSSVSPSVLTYDIDTAGGQSGAPVWQLRNGQRHAVGIHTNGSPTGNSATRINSAVYNNLIQWRDEGEGE